MKSVAVAERMTAEQYLALEPSESDPPRSELIDGEIVVTAPRPLHQIVGGELYLALADWSRAQPGRGRVMWPLDIQLDERNVFEPDILWYAEGRAPRRAAEPPSPLPDLAVEVRSPSTWRYDIGAKKSHYERNGLPELWLVDTAAEEVLAFRRSAQAAASFDVALELTRDDSLHSPLLPGFALQLGELFAGD
jgi:Uma2 family endonuclease